MEAIKLKEVKQGDYFKRTPDAKAVYVRDYYERSTKRYSCYKFDDVNAESFINGEKLVYVGFDF